MVVFCIPYFNDTVDGRNPANQLRLVVYPIMYKVLYIPGGARFLPSTVYFTQILRFCSSILETDPMVTLHSQKSIYIYIILWYIYIIFFKIHFMIFLNIYLYIYIYQFIYILSFKNIKDNIIRFFGEWLDTPQTWGHCLYEHKLPCLVKVNLMRGANSRPY